MARTPTPWGRLAAEFVVIVVGVLVALWAESWRERYVERQRVGLYLTELRSEVSEARRALAESIALDSVTLTKTQRLRSLLRAETPEDTPAGELFQWPYSTYLPTLPTLELLVRTRDLELIDSAPLRIRMRAVAIEVERVIPTLETTMDRLNVVYGELVTKGEVLWRRQGHAGSPTSGGTLPTLKDSGLALLASEPEITALVIQFGVALNIRTNRKRTLRTALGELAVALNGPV